MKLKFLFTPLFCLAFAVACDKSPSITFDRTEFDKQKTEWNLADIKNYTFTLSYFSSATGPIQETITVVNGVVTSESENKDIHWFTSSISKIYESIESTFDGKMQDSNKDSDYKISDLVLEIEYDEKYHYPKKVSYTVGYDKPVDGGGGYNMSISNFNMPANEGE